MSAVTRPPPRGEMVDIGGRRLRIVCEGPADASGPTVLMEAGAFGFAADWAVIQHRLAGRGVRSCAYDRAGLGFSDPGPSPRDGLAVAEDLEKLVQAAGLRGPFILVGHSMAGLRVRLFALRNPGSVAGLVLVDAATPEATDTESMRGFVGAFANLSRLAGWGASAGLFKPFSFMGDSIGLEGAAANEKRWAFAHGPHNRWSADEAEHWLAAAEQAKGAGKLDPAWPVAVVTAGQGHGARTSMQGAPARDSRHGSFRNVPQASHASILGVEFADEVVKAIEFVRQAATEPSGPESARRP